MGVILSPEGCGGKVGLRLEPAALAALGCWLAGERPGQTPLPHPHPPAASGVRASLKKN